jgi:hypothetical protein
MEVQVQDFNQGIQGKFSEYPKVEVSIWGCACTLVGLQCMYGHPLAPFQLEDNTELPVSAGMGEFSIGSGPGMQELH